MTRTREGYKIVKGLFGKYDEIPEEWEVKKFGRVVKINPQTKIEQNTVPYIPMQAVDTKKPNFNYFEERELSKNSNLSRFQNNDVLIARITPSIENGKTSIVENFRRSGIVSSELIVLRASKKVLPRYLYYYVKNYRIRQFAISQMMGTTGRQRVPNSVFTKDLNFELPPFSEQKQIASILSNVDALIESTQDLVEKAEMLKKGLMQKLLIRGIGHTKFKKVKGMFRKENEIPEEWEVKKFGRVVKINPQTKIEQNTVPYIPMQAVDTKKPNFNYFEERKLSKNSNLSRFQNNDVLIARITPSIENGKTSIVENFRRSGIVSSELIVLRASKKVLPRYLYYYVKNYRIRQFAISQMMGTTGRQRVPNSVFTKDLNFELPPFSEQKQIASILSGIDAYIQKNQLWKAGKIQEQINEAFLSLTSFA